MWIFTNQSFLSIVQHRDKPNVFLVRARKEGDIEKAIPNAKVTRTDDADYRYRAEVKRSIVTAMVMREVSAIDYDNFKGSIPSNEHERHDAYIGVWQVMNRYQYLGDINESGRVSTTKSYNHATPSGIERYE